MPNCFQLLRNGTPVNLVDVDKEMCKAFGAECDPDKWYRSWYNIIGFGLALGRTWDDLREIDPEDVDVVDWLEANYTVKAWAER